MGVYGATCIHTPARFLFFFHHRFLTKSTTYRRTSSSCPSHENRKTRGAEGVPRCFPTPETLGGFKRRRLQGGAPYPYAGMQYGLAVAAAAVLPAERVWRDRSWRLLASRELLPRFLLASTAHWYRYWLLVCAALDQTRTGNASPVHPSVHTHQSGT